MSANQRALNIGTGVESGDGDPLRVIFGKIATTQFVATAVATGGAGGGTGTGGVATSRQILSGGLATGGG
ncbi:hypothetical protein FV233_30055, partial [Methylobacterium sp. WL7]